MTGGVRRARPRLDSAQRDRAAGVLLAGACGDALGVPYEFARPPGPGELAEMKGGGLGPFAPGEWSDDTAMAGCVARVAARGLDLASAEALDAIGDGFLAWYADGPPDVGIQTSHVLGEARRIVTQDPSGSAGAVLTSAAARYAERHAHSAGNGALMRTGPVALAHLGDREGCARAARAVASLTHADPLAGDACVLWSEAIRVAVMEGRFDVSGGLDLLPDDGRRGQWRDWLGEVRAEAESPSDSVPGRTFVPNGFTVTALQAALVAVLATPVPDERSTPGADASYACLHLQHALHAAVRIGDDTDTVAAIAGALLGARWGASAVPWQWRRAVHGWPGEDARDLVAHAVLAASGGVGDARGWPTATDVPYGEPAAAVAVPHPFDAEVLLGTHASRGHGCDAVVSLCRTGREQACFEGATNVIEVRLLDDDRPEANPHLDFVLRDAAEAVRGLRAEGKRVLLQCVAAQQRTPSVAVAYAVLLGAEPDEARSRVLAVLDQPRGWGSLWEAAGLNIR